MRPMPPGSGTYEARGNTNEHCKPHPNTKIIRYLTGQLNVKSTLNLGEKAVKQLWPQVLTPAGISPEKYRPHL